jgi:hypothetical protein
MRPFSRGTEVPRHDLLHTLLLAFAVVDERLCFIDSQEVIEAGLSGESEAEFLLFSRALRSRSAGGNRRRESCGWKQAQGIVRCVLVRRIGKNQTVPSETFQQSLAACMMPRARRLMHAC